jgi:predicted nucleic acid-binding protein
MIYLDTSAALKLVMPEAETAGLELWIAERAGVPRISSRLLRIEMLRSVARTAPQRMSRANVVLSSIALVSIDDVAATAEVIGDRTLRSLNAIHLATAHQLRAELTAFVCYDKRLGIPPTRSACPSKPPPDPHPADLPSGPNLLVPLMPPARTS